MSDKGFFILDGEKHEICVDALRGAHVRSVLPESKRGYNLSVVDDTGVLSNIDNSTPLRPYMKFVATPPAYSDY